MSPVVRLGAQNAHAHLILLAEELQQPLVLGTHPVLHVGHRLHELVLGEACRVRLEVLLAVGRQTNQAGLEGSGSALAQTHITEDLLLPRGAAERRRLGGQAGGRQCGWGCGLLRCCSGWWRWCGRVCGC